MCAPVCVSVFLCTFPSNCRVAELSVASTLNIKNPDGQSKKNQKNMRVGGRAAVRGRGEVGVDEGCCLFLQDFSRSACTAPERQDIALFTGVLFDCVCVSVSVRLC